MKKVKVAFLALALVAGAMSAFSSSKKLDSVVYGIRNVVANTPTTGQTTYYLTEMSADVDYTCENVQAKVCTGHFAGLNTTAIRSVDGAAPNYTIVTSSSTALTQDLPGQFQLQ